MKITPVYGGSETVISDYAVTNDHEDIVQFHGTYAECIAYMQKYGRIYVPISKMNNTYPPPETDSK